MHNIDTVHDTYQDTAVVYREDGHTYLTVTESGDEAELSLTPAQAKRLGEALILSASLCQAASA